MMTDLPEKTLKKVAVVVGGILLLGAFAGLNFVYKPVQKKYDLILDSQKEAENKSKLLNNAAASKDLLNKYKAGLVTAKDTAWMIDTANSAAQKAGVLIVSVQPSNLEVNPDYGQILLRIDTRGDFHKIAQFVNLLEGNVKFIHVLELKMMGKDRNAEGPPVRASLLISSYYPLSDN